MAVDHRLPMLQQALRRCGSRPGGRYVVMAARVTPAFGIGIRDIPAKDPGAGIPGGRVLPIWINGSGILAIVAWNTGEASDLKRYGNRSHAEAQFYDFMKVQDFSGIEIEISHSPCTACAAMLIGLLRRVMQKGTTTSREFDRRVGNRVMIGSAVAVRPSIPASLRWGELYDMPPQATTPQCLRELQDVGWKLGAPRSAIPNEPGTPAITLL